MVKCNKYQAENPETRKFCGKYEADVFLKTGERRAGFPIGGIFRGGDLGLFFF